VYLLVLRIVGQWRILAICDRNGKADAVDFLRSPGPNDPYASSRRLMLVQLETVAQLPHPPRNTAVSHQVDEEFQIYEFIKGDLRLVYFYDEGRTIILSHGFLKGGRKFPPAERTRARKTKTAYFEAKARHDLHFIEEEMVDG